MSDSDHELALPQEPSFAAARHERDAMTPLERFRAWVVFSTVGNPVLVKEFRTRMRGARAYWLLLAYTLLLAGVAALMYFSHETSMAQGSGTLTVNADSARELGRNIYYFVFIAQAIMVALITPALTSGSVTIEREQRSYELLVTTPLKPVDIIRGKMTAAVAFVVLLLTVSLPVASLSFLVGGVSPTEVFCSYLILALSAFVYGALGIFWSATLRSTAVATVVTYLTVVAFFLVTVIPTTFGGASGPNAEPMMPFKSVNPIAATMHGVQAEYLFAIQIPSWVFGALLNLLLGLVITTAAMDRLEHFDPPKPAWLRAFSTLFWCTFMVAFFGPITGGLAKSWTGTGALQESLGISIGIILALAVLAAPVLNTGDLVIRRGESAVGRYLRGMLPDRMWQNDLSCGVPLTFLWAVFALSLLPLAVYVNGKGAMLLPDRLFIPASILCLSVLVGIMGVGHLLSVLLPSRWAACILTYLFAVVVMLLPQFALLGWYQASNRPHNPQLLWQLFYLAPYDALAHLVNPGTFWTDHPPLALGRGVPPWTVTSPLYVGLGVLCFLLAAGRIAQVDRQLNRRAQPEGEAAYAPAR